MRGATPAAGPVRVARARPLLGTMVMLRLQADGAGEGAGARDGQADVQGGGGDAVSHLDAAADAAFAAIADVHRLMSFHDPASDVRRLARARPGERVHVARATAAVLARAQAWARASGGAFDAGCGARAVAAGWLPPPDDAAPPGNLPFEDALRIVRTPPPDTARRHGRAAGVAIDVLATTWLDLGGIAKGWAVDRAVAVLRRHRVPGGVVNAGGDLRVFGTAEEAIRLRLPDVPAHALDLAMLRDGACATSARGEVSVRPGLQVDEAALAAVRSITVFAPTACAADALATVCWVLGDAARPLLQLARAQAVRVDATGRMTAMGPGITS